MNTFYSLDEQFNQKTLSSILPSIGQLRQCSTAFNLLTETLQNSMNQIKNYFELMKQKEVSQLQMTMRLFQKLRNTLQIKQSKSVNIQKMEVKQRIDYNPISVMTEFTDINKFQSMFASQINLNPQNLIESPKQNIQCKAFIKFTGQIYSCLKCIKSSLHEQYLWDNPSQYLTHIQKVHHIIPSFEVITNGQFSEIPFSHVYFRNQLTNIIKNQEYRPYKQILFLLQKRRFQSLLICSCLQFNIKAKSFCRGSPILLNQLDFYNHLRCIHSGIFQQHSSHTVKKMKQHLSLILAIGRQKLPQQKLDSFKLELRKKLSKQNIFRINSLVSLAPKINIIQLTSKLSHLISMPNIYDCIPYCKICRQYFPNNYLFKKHKISVHTIQEYENCEIQNYSNKHMLSYLKHMEQYYKQRNEFNSFLNSEQRRLLNLQCYLIKPKIFICGECEKVFPKKEHDILSHLYTEHDHQVDATHQFKFLMKTDHHDDNEINAQ